MSYYLLAIDQGTTNSRAIIFDKAGRIIALHELALTQSYPHDGWVEQSPQEMLANTIACCRAVLTQAKLDAKSIAAIGITNQRETTIIWDRKTGQPIYPAIVWQDRRTAAFCEQLAKTKLASLIAEKTGLRLDPYFSASKIRWILDNVKNAREGAERGELLFGTIDTYLLWQLSQHKSHATDASNASRTLLFNIHTQQWDDDLIKAFNIPENILPAVLDNTAHFGDLDETILGERIPIMAMVGDQQAACIGQACFSPGMVKATYGTGAFMLLNTGDHAVHSHHQLLSTVAYRINNKVTYGLEGSIFSAGSTIKWLRDQLHFIKTAAESEVMARELASTEGTYLIPAFTGLGAPYWDPHARAALMGLTNNTNPKHIVRAGLESVVYQTRDLLDAMAKDSQFEISILRVDGGMTMNTWLLQFLADLLNIHVHRPQCIETTALGAAYLAGLQVGFYQSLDEIAALWQMEMSFTAAMPEGEREQLYAGWKRAVGRVVDK